MSRRTPFSRDADTMLGLATALDTAYRFRRVARVARPATMAGMAAVVHAGTGTAGTLRSRRSRRYQRRAAYHAQRALIRSYRVGPSRAPGDKHVRSHLVRAGEQARKAVNPPDHTKRNRLLAGTALLGLAGSVTAYLLNRGRLHEATVPAGDDAASEMTT
jgi:hypothetical protein